MTRLTLDAAMRVVNGALAAERVSENRPIAVAVCDAGGHVVALAREDGAPPLLAQIARAKAFTCMVYGKSPAQLEASGADHPVWFAGISNVAQSTMGLPLAGSKGGLFLLDADGAAVGAVGVAGDTGEQDVALAAKGAAAGGFGVKG